LRRSGHKWNHKRVRRVYVLATVIASERFNVIDDFNRETLAIEIDLSLPAARVTRILDQLVELRGYPKQLRSAVPSVVLPSYL